MLSAPSISLFKNNFQNGNEFWPHFPSSFLSLSKGSRETFKPTCRLTLNYRARAKSIGLFLMKMDGWERQKGVENGAQVTAMEGPRQKLFRERHLSLSNDTHLGKHCSYSLKPGQQEFKSVLYHPPTVWP